MSTASKGMSAASRACQQLVKMSDLLHATVSTKLVRIDIPGSASLSPLKICRDTEKERKREKERGRERGSEGGREGGKEGGRERESTRAACQVSAHTCTQ